MPSEQTAKTFRRLVAAEGYLELGMPEHALEELDTISVENLGSFEAAVHYLTGESLKALERFDAAADSLQRAATMLPLAASKSVWESLSECLQATGDEERAHAARMNADMLAKVETFLRLFARAAGDAIVLNLSVDPASSDHHDGPWSR